MNNLSTLMDILSITFNVNKRILCVEKNWLCLTTNTHSVYIPLSRTSCEKAIKVDGDCHVTTNVKTFIQVCLSMIGVDDCKRVMLSWRLNILNINTYSIYAELHDTTSPILIGSFRVNAPFHSSDCIASNYETLYDVIM